MAFHYGLQVWSLHPAWLPSMAFCATFLSSLAPAAMSRRQIGGIKEEAGLAGCAELELFQVGLVLEGGDAFAELADFLLFGESENTL
jgi:hypothetical protein